MRTALALAFLLATISAADPRGAYPGHNPSSPTLGSVAAFWNPSDAGNNIVLSNGNLTASGGYGSLRLAVDFGAAKVWLWNPQTGKWNGDVIGNQNPATGTGGLAFTATGTLYPIWTTCTINACPGGSPNASNNADFGATTFVYPVPTGFSSWNSLTSSTVTWNPSDKDTNITLSNGNLTATAGGVAATFIGVRATAGASSGKGYFEIIPTSINSDNFIIGLCQAGCSLQNYPGSGGATTGFSWRDDGSVFGITGTPGNFELSNTSWRMVRATPSRAAGKRYFETTMTLTGGFNSRIGIADGTASVGNYCGVDTHGLALLAANGAATVIYNAGTLATFPTIANGDIIGVALDTGTGKIWFFDTNTGKWNNDILANQNPATGVGGFQEATIGSPYFACDTFNLFNQNDINTTNFGATAFANSVPAGFVAWNAP